MSFFVGGLLHYKWQLSLHPLQGRGSDQIHCLSLTACYSLHTHIHTPLLGTVSDPYAPKTEKQIPFHKGFFLVMRHGPYLTLTAAFLFITVAIQVKGKYIYKAAKTKNMTLDVSVNAASPGSWLCERIADAQCWFDQCRRALTESSWFKASLRTLESDSSAADSRCLSVIYRSLLPFWRLGFRLFPTFPSAPFL